MHLIQQPLLDQLQTERLIFSPLVNSDIIPLQPFFTNPVATRFLTGMNLTDPAVQQGWISRQQERYAKNGYGLCAIRLKANNILVGQCGLLDQIVDEKEELEIGYHFLPEHWGNGYATEAAIACKEYAFKNKLAESLISIIHPDNIASQKVAMRNGMQKTIMTTFKGIGVYIFRIAAL